MFGDLIPVSWYEQQCVDIFGPQFNASTIATNVAWTNTYYGGKDVEGSNIVFPNGSIDPWHALGIIADIAPTENAVFIQVCVQTLSLAPACCRVVWVFGGDLMRGSACGRVPIGRWHHWSPMRGMSCFGAVFVPLKSCAKRVFFFQFFAVLTVLPFRPPRLHQHPCIECSMSVSVCAFSVSSCFAWLLMTVVFISPAKLPHVLVSLTASLFAVGPHRARRTALTCTQPVHRTCQR